MAMDSAHIARTARLSDHSSKESPIPNGTNSSTLSSASTVPNEPQITQKWESTGAGGCGHSVARQIARRLARVIGTPALRRCGARATLIYTLHTASRLDISPPRLLLVGIQRDSAFSGVDR